MRPIFGSNDYRTESETTSNNGSVLFRASLSHNRDDSQRQSKDRFHFTYDSAKLAADNIKGASAG